MQCVRCIMYIKNIYFVNIFYQSIIDYYLYLQCTDYYALYSRDMLCEVYTVIAIHYRYIVEVVEKTIGRTQMFDHWFEIKFMERAIGCVKN